MNGRHSLEHLVSSRYALICGFALTNNKFYQKENSIYAQQDTDSLTLGETHD